MLYNNIRLPNAPDPANVFRIDQAIIPMLSDMMKTGVLVNPGACHDLSVMCERIMQDAENQIEHLTNRRYNIGSPDQVSNLLFNDLGLSSKGLKLTKTGTRYSVDDDALLILSVQSPVCELVQTYREAAKIKGTYADTLPLLLDHNNRVHTTFKNTRAATGRLSSANPNLQNIPIRTELGAFVRKAFTPTPGYALISVDYSQIEMRWVAEMAKARFMLQCFLQNKDLHTEHAALIFKKPTSQINKKTERTPTKNAGFGIVYGITPIGLLAQFVSMGLRDLWTEESTAKLIEDWFGINPEVRALMDQYWDWAVRYGKVWDLWGRCRWTPGAQSVHRGLQAQTRRECGNMPIQGGAQGLLKCAMKFIWDQTVLPWRARGVDLRCLLQVHDELIFEAPVEYAQRIGEEIRARMVDCGGDGISKYFQVPIESSLTVCETSWGDMKD